MSNKKTRMLRRRRIFNFNVNQEDRHGSNTPLLYYADSNPELTRFFSKMVLMSTEEEEEGTSSSRYPTLIQISIALPSKEEEEYQRETFVKLVMRATPCVWCFCWV